MTVIPHSPAFRQLARRVRIELDTLAQHASRRAIAGIAAISVTPPTVGTSAMIADDNGWRVEFQITMRYQNASVQRRRSVNGHNAAAVTVAAMMRASGIGGEESRTHNRGG
jgi:hypothetical protein